MFDKSKAVNLYFCQTYLRLFLELKFMLNIKQYPISLLVYIVLLFGIQTTSAQLIKKIKVNVGVGTSYDDNLLKYSEKYLERFMNNKDEGRFDITTYDDLILKTKLQASYSTKLFKKRKTKLSTTLQYNKYLVNNIKSWSYFGIGLQQYFLKKASFKVSYSYIPEFYVRNFRDDDLISIYGYESNTFTPYAFAKDNYNFWVQNTFFKKTKLKLSAGYAKYYHNKYYTEYDCDNLVLGIKVQQQLSKKANVSLAYQNTVSKAKGFDEAGESLDFSDEPDASYNENKMELRLFSKLPKLKKKKNDLELKVGYSNRGFSSKHTYLEDPLHRGRVDNNYTLVFNYNIRLAKKTKLTLSYNRYQRISENNGSLQYQEGLSDEKDYKQNQIGFLLTYTLL